MTINIQVENAIASHIETNVDMFIRNAELTMECQKCQRKIKELRIARENSFKEHNDVRRDYIQRMADASNALKIVMYGNKSFEHYLSAAQMQHEISPPLYIVRKEAEVLKSTRLQELFDTYLSVTKEQNNKIQNQLSRFRDMQMSLLNEKENAISIVRQQLHVVVEKNVKSLSHLNRGNSFAERERFHQRRSSLEHLHDSTKSLTYVTKNESSHRKDNYCFHLDEATQASNSRFNKSPIHFMSAGAA